ncbi:LptF/LptG family permease [Rhizobium sp. C4]|uniref:LptF/LptG family permease n=1 Tax=Rhizobium sp. C4 TaxID=1349800 RepID=UPI001E2E8F15|nr:LptF/LptG family permease [Rhizobium sp. C4]MCD2171853.1 LptF/LptG family permease [Rhizobium sp. C4]
MTLIERYIALRVIKMAVASILPVLAVIWIVQVLARVNLVTDSGQSISSFFQLAGLILPTIIPMVIPFGVVIGVAQTFSAMNADSEFAVIDAAGMPRRRLIRPVIIVALGACAISFAVDNLVEPIVRVQARKMIAAVYADLLSSVIEEKTFRKIDDGLYLQISKRLHGRTLSGIFVADYRDPESELVYYAKEGAIDEAGTTLVMHDGEVDRRSANGDISVVKFMSYAFDLSQLTKSRGGMTLRAIDRDLPFLFHPDPNDTDVKAYSGEYTAELHRRLTEWSFPLVYGLIAFVIAGRVRTQREIRLHPVISGLAIAFVLRWLSYYMSNQIADAPIFVTLLYAVPLAITAICMILILSARTLHLPRWMTRGLGRIPLGGTKAGGGR